MEDARKLGDRNWRNAGRNRDSWQKLLKKALAQRGCCVNDDDDDDPQDKVYVPDYFRAGFDRRF